MHHRNIYRNKEKTDFTRLAKSYPPLSQHLTETSSIDFHDKTALLALTQAFLHRDFNLTLTMPPHDTLIPTVPQKLNYILWLEDLLKPVRRRGHDIKGIDIGTGASCVYALIGARKNGWSFLATEIDEVSKEFAERNVRDNELGHLIDVRLVGSNDVLCGVIGDDSEFDFCMCNPPFYQSEDEARGPGTNRTDRRRERPMTCSGTAKEMVTDGGEVDFVRSIVSDSKKLRTRIRWYTSMLGKKSSVEPLFRELKSEGVTVTTTKFVQGKTHRWAIAWTFHELIDFPVARRMVKKRPAQTLLSFCVQAECLSVKTVTQQLMSILRELQISITPDIPNKGSDGNIRFTCTAHKNTWIHSRRKRRAQMRSHSNDTTNDHQITLPSQERPPAPYILRYDTTVKLADSPTTKRHADSSTCVCVEMESTDNRDLMYQLLVYLKNRLSNKYCTEM